MDNLILYKSPFSKKRIGRDCDGGYVITMLPGDYDMFISGGVSDDISFEIDFLSLYPNLSCNAFDGTVSALPSSNPRIRFHQKYIGNGQNNTTTLQEYIEPYDNVFMKIDIEGHEFRMLPMITESHMKKIKQLVIEFHSPADIKLFPNYFKGLGDITNEYMFSVFEKINQTHTLVHFHGNNACKSHVINGIVLPNVFECTFIRNDFIVEKSRNDEKLPTTVDRPNDPNSPQYEFTTFPFVN